MVFSSTSTRVWYTKNCNNWEAESNSFFHPEQNSSNKIFFTNSSVIIPLKNVSISEKAVSWWYFSFKTFLCTFKCTDEHTQTLWCKDCGTQKTVLLFVITFDHIDSTKGPHPVWKMSCYEEENILLLEKMASKVFKTLIDILPCLFYSHVEKKVSTGLYAVCTKNIVKLLSE